jgi:alpha-glucosidase (family GH31 glycosyl hydrolase)
MDFVLRKGYAELRTAGTNDIEMKVMLSENKDVDGLVKTFHSYLGKYYLPPFWGLGFHQSKWGLNNSHDAATII